MSKVQQKIKKLNRQILSRVETELDVLRTNNSGLTKEIDDMYIRLRKGILDDIGDCEREIDDGT
jgi:hypothetical protein